MPVPRTTGANTASKGPIHIHVATAPMTNANVGVLHEACPCKCIRSVRATMKDGRIMFGMAVITRTPAPDPD